MALPKQAVSLFFGATNQDTSAKGVKVGDLILAENVRQVKGGEWSKRDGFTQTAQAYAGQASGLTPDSVVSPDGVQVLSRDADTDHVFARAASNASNVDKGHAARFVPYVSTLFPALGSGEQQAPMAKQCGKYIVWLEDPGHFRIAELNPDKTVTAGSPTRAPDAIASQSASISVSTISSAASTAIRSFALIDFVAFDADNLWILWVDQTNKIFSWKVPHSNLDGGTYHVVYSATETSQYKKYFTSVTATYVEGHLAVAACGVGIDKSAYFLSPGVAGSAATGFRYVDASNPSNYGCSFSVHGHLNASTAEFSASGTYESPYSRQVAAACTMLSSYGFQTSASYWHYAYYGVTTETQDGQYVPGIVVIKVAASDLTSTVFDSGAVIAAPDTYGKPSDFDATCWSKYGWFYLGQVAGKETSTGVEVAFTAIPYYVTSPASGNEFKAWNPDYLQTYCLSLNTGTGAWSGKWSKLGCCVAQGIIRQRDNTEVLLVDGANYLLTVWEDKEALQTTYHLREWDTGEIVAQIAYGRSAHVGHVGTRDLQVQQHVSDVQNPMLCSWKVNQYLHGAILIGIQSENQNSSVDVASLVIQDWDYSSNAKPVWQNAFHIMGMAFAPGPIPTVFNGFQQLREAGPLVYPSRPETYLGESGS